VTEPHIYGVHVSFRRIISGSQLIADPQFRKTNMSKKMGKQYAKEIILLNVDRSWAYENALRYRGLTGLPLEINALP